MTTSNLILDLLTIHPDLAAWGQTKIAEGWTEEGIRERLLTLMLVARPVGDTEGGVSIQREDDFAFSTAIPARMVADLFVTAIESGIGYWCEGIYAKNWSAPDSKTKWWYDDEVYIGGDRFEIEVHDAEADEADDKIMYVKGHLAIQRGLSIMAHKYPQHMKDILADNHDALTADVFLQCVVFGEIVYG